MAGALAIRMGGPSVYGGKIVEKPYIGDQGGRDYLQASVEAIRIGYTTSCLGTILATAMLSLWKVL